MKQETTMALQTESPDELMRSLCDLRLNHLATEFNADITSMPEKERLIVIQYLTKWTRVEISQRQEARIAHCVKSARFVTTKTIDTFDFNYNNSVASIQKAYMSLYHSISRSSLPNAVFTGTAGLGKTHLARALGYAACQKGLSVLCTTAAAMVNELACAQKTFTLENDLKKYRRPLILIIDELGYVALDAQASNLFFQVISARHDMKLGTIATTNLPFGKFNQIFANDAIAHAIIDRLVNTAEVFYVEGPSYREKEREIARQKRRGK